MPDLGILGLEFENNIVIFESAPSNLFNCKISRKNKNALFVGTFDQKCHIFVFLGKNLKKTIVIIEISTIEFV